MVLRIPVTSQTEARLKEQAAAAGKDVSEYVASLVERAAAKPSLDEVLEPLRKQFAKSGTTDDELIDQVTVAQKAYRAEKRKKTA